LELVRSTKDSPIASLVAAGQVPDIIFTANTVLNNYHQLAVPYDLSNLIKQRNIDLSQFDPVTMKAIQEELGPSGTMGLPFSNNYYVTFYNKEIFDKFGVAYPKDKMTWEQMTDLAKKVTREDGGTQYHGLLPGTVNTFGMGMALPYVDAKTNKPWRIRQAGRKYSRLERRFTRFRATIRTPSSMEPPRRAMYL
jgi:multiple sugar transport system substrate-binding protein